MIYQFLCNANMGVTCLISNGALSTILLSLRHPNYSFAEGNLLCKSHICILSIFIVPLTSCAFNLWSTSRSNIKFWDSGC